MRTVFVIWVSPEDAENGPIREEIRRNKAAILLWMEVVI